MSSALEVSLVLVCIVFVLWLRRRWQKLSYFKELDIKGPKPNLFFGNLLELYSKGPLQCHREWVTKYGRVLGYYYGMTPVLLITDPQLLKNIFIKDFSKFVDRELFNPLVHRNTVNKLDQNIVELTGQDWKDIRKVLNPTFTMAKMDRMGGVVQSSINTMLDLMQEKQGLEFEVFDMFQRLAMDVIARTALGVRTNVQTNQNSSLLHTSRIILCMPFKDPFIFIGMSFPTLRRFCNSCQNWLLSVMNRFCSPRDSLRRVIQNVLDMRRSNPHGKNSDLLQLLLYSKIGIGNTNQDSTDSTDNVDAEKEWDGKAIINKFRYMTNGEILSNAMVVLLAGYDTTSSVLAYTSYLLGKNPDIQEELFEEIRQNIPSDHVLEYAVLKKLPLLDKVMRESLRLYPPLNQFCNRFAAKEVRYGELRIPQGTLVRAPVYLMHHDPAFWTDPEKFDPERFSNNKPNSRGIIYLPFGVGPRHCLAARFALMEMKMVLASILCRFRIRIGEKSKDELFVESRLRTLIPSKGVYVKLEERVE